MVAGSLFRLRTRRNSAAIRSQTGTPLRLHTQTTLQHASSLSPRARRRAPVAPLQHSSQRHLSLSSLSRACPVQPKPTSIVAPSGTPLAVISSAVGQRVFFSHRSCDDVGPRSEKSSAAITASEKARTSKNFTRPLASQPNPRRLSRNYEQSSNGGILPTQTQWWKRRFPSKRNESRNDSEGNHTSPVLSQERTSPALGLHISG